MSGRLRPLAAGALTIAGSAFACLAFPNGGVWFWFDLACLSFALITF